MKCREYFAIEAKNNKSFKEYIKNINCAFSQNALHVKHSFQNTVTDDDYDHIILNQIILKKDFYLDIDFILGGSREYLKLNCLVLAFSNEKINETKSKLEDICGIKNA